MLMTLYVLAPQLSSKWHELGTAVDMDNQSLNNLLNYDPEYCMHATGV